MLLLAGRAAAQDVFPDGTPVPDWFRRNEPTLIKTLGKQYRITDYGVLKDSTVVQTKKIQSAIDQAHQQGGGVIVIPKGTFLSGSLFFKQGVHLHLEKDAVLKGSDDISEFPVMMTRIEGQSLNYFPALVNVDGTDGFTLSGEGTINGNGLRYWKSFWLRREVNPDCTNMEELRPRLLFVSNSRNVQISGVKLMNSPFWTTHFYKCENVKLLDLYIYSPASPVRAPSTDAIDLDVCSNVLIKGCYMSVNDDAVALKGGKGPFADKDANNGGNRNIIIEDCTYGFCHSALTCGSESVHNRNIILRRCTVDNTRRLLQLKMRPDTPQHYEYILIEDVTGYVHCMIDVQPWTQFFDLKGEKDIRVSHANHIRFHRLSLRCHILLDMLKSDQYTLSRFSFENLDVKVKEDPVIPGWFFTDFRLKDIKINNQKLF